MSSITAPQTATKTNRSRVWKWIAGAVAALALVLLGAFGFMLYRMNYIPPDLDLATTRLSNQGIYKASYTPKRQPIAINQIHSWTIHVATADGQMLVFAIFANNFENSSAVINAATDDIIMRLATYRSR